MNHQRCNCIQPTTSRRDLLTRAGAGFGALALSVLEQERAAADARPFAARVTHLKPRAKSVIWCFMEGGPSSLDLFDPKPELIRRQGQPLPPSFKRPITAMGVGENPLLPSHRTFKQHGQSGLWVSDWYPHLARHADELCVLRSCWADGLTHVNGVTQMNTGTTLAGRPSLGAWVTYGMGTANQNLPAFVVLLDDKEPVGGPRDWGSGFMPATYQGTQFRTDDTPVLHLNTPAGTSDERQRSKLDFIRQLNERHARGQSDDELDARIAAYELAFRMQAHAPEAIDLSKESEATKQSYGLDDPLTEKFGRNCLLARRLVERGVRFVQLYCGTGSQWDAHTDLEGNHTKMCKVSDQPVAALIADLKQRGMLDDTLVIWGGEFGRTPMSEKTKGRDHNPWGFTTAFAGGGVRAGHAVGATDELGLYAIESKAHVNDIHATILHLLGMDHWKMTYFHAGRHERATVNGGEVVKGMLA